MTTPDEHRLAGELRAAFALRLASCTAGRCPPTTRSWTSPARSTRTSCRAGRRRRAARQHRPGDRRAARRHPGRHAAGTRQVGPRLRRLRACTRSASTTCATPPPARSPWSPPPSARSTPTSWRRNPFRVFTSMLAHGRPPLLRRRPSRGWRPSSAARDLFPPELLDAGRPRGEQSGTAEEDADALPRPRPRGLRAVAEPVDQDWYEPGADLRGRRRHRRRRRHPHQPPHPARARHRRPLRAG